jgi:hypothetical protein
MGLFTKRSTASSTSTNIPDSSDLIDSNASFISHNSGAVFDSNSLKIITTLSASVERLTAESIANKEVRAAMNERFAKLSEQMGELRNMLRNNEKSVTLIEARSEKTSGLVEAVQPQMLLSTVNKTDFKLEALKAKVDANDLVYNKIREDVKDLRNKFAVFRNLEMVKELNEDSKTRFKELKKVEFEIVKHADRVESMFNEVAHSIKDTKENVKAVTDISESLKKLLLTVDKFKTELSLKVSSEEFAKLKVTIDSSKSEIISVVAKDFESYKKRALKEIELSVKQDEIKLVHQLLRDDLKNFGIDLDSLNDNSKVLVNGQALKMLMFMNMKLFAKNYFIDNSKLAGFKDNPFTFTLLAYIAMKLKEGDVSSLKKELLLLGFNPKRVEQLILNAKLFDKTF